MTYLEAATAAGLQIRTGAKCPFQVFEEIPYPCPDQGITCEECWGREKPDDVKLNSVFNGMFNEKADTGPAESHEKADMVNHPSHYTSGGIECIDALESAASCHEDPVNAGLTWQVMKYLWRWPLKNGLEDLKKAEWYLDRLIAKIEKESEETT